MSDTPIRDGIVAKMRGHCTMDEAILVDQIGDLERELARSKVNAERYQLLKALISDDIARELLHADLTTISFDAALDRRGTGTTEPLPLACHVEGGCLNATAGAPCPEPWLVNCRRCNSTRVCPTYCGLPECIPRCRHDDRKEGRPLHDAPEFLKHRDARARNGVRTGHGLPFGFAKWDYQGRTGDRSRRLQ